MIDLYTWSTPNGRKISIALEELAVPYKVLPVDITAGEQHSAAFRRISPNGKIPAIHDRENGLSLMESGAILLYLATKCGCLLPTAVESRFRVIEWLMWQVGGFGPMLGQAHHFMHSIPGKVPYAENRYGKEAIRLYGVLEERLNGRDHVAGDYSIADIAIWPWVARFARHRVSLSEFPNVSAWYRKVAARPAVARGYAVPLAEEPIPFPPD